MLEMCFPLVYSGCSPERPLGWALHLGALQASNSDLSHLAVGQSCRAPVCTALLLQVTALIQQGLCSDRGPLGQHTGMSLLHRVWRRYLGTSVSLKHVMSHQ